MWRSCPKRSPARLTAKNSDMPKKPPRLPEPITRERKLTEDEQQLWHAVMEGGPMPAPPKPPSEPDLFEASVLRPDAAQLNRFLSAGLGNTPAKQSGTKATPVDWRVARKLRQGKTEPEAKLDLHGLTQDKAHAQLAGFLQRAQRDNMRAVLVITGKGTGLSGILRTALPGWLSSPPCAPLVAAFAKAHPHHGGDGAYYVLVRKAK